MLSVSNDVVIIEHAGKKYVWLDILPDPVDDTDILFDIFVKTYSLVNQKEPHSYNQEGRGLEYHYPYIQRLRVTGAVQKSINQVMKGKEE